MNCPNCGSKTPKEITGEKLAKEITMNGYFLFSNNENIMLNGYKINIKKPVFQCKNKSCNRAFNEDK